MTHESRKTFIIGIEELDKLIGEIKSPYTILIAGHPGSGKTTLASTICYKNALRGKKCLYATLHEDREKLFEYMEKLGIRLADIETLGLLKFLKLPMTLETREFIETLNKEISSDIDIMVIDSINAVLEPIKEASEKRGWLLNYFYNISHFINGLIVLISELPFGKDSFGENPLDFIMDAVFILKYRIEDHLVIRLLELRKTRGVPMHIAEIPFTIVESKGIVAYVPPLLEDIPERGETVEPLCNHLRNKISHFHKNFLVNVFFPPETIYGREALASLIAYAIKYNYKILVISYITPPDLLIKLIRDLLILHGIPGEEAGEIINKYMVFRAVNPFSYNVYELAIREIELVREVNPDIVVFHGIQVLEELEPSFHFKELYKQVMYLKSRNTGIVRVGSPLDQNRAKAIASISDLTFIVERVEKNGYIDYLLRIYRRFKEPSLISGEESKECMKSHLEYIKQVLQVQEVD